VPSSQPTSSDGVLLVDRLKRSFGGLEVVRDFSLELHPGERVALWGPNGSGKTTVLRCIAGTLIPTAGQVSICGHRSGSIRARRLIGTSLSQERSFYLRLSARANLFFFAQLREETKKAATRRVRALEDELELSNILAERVDRCSTGMIQQLAFARALLGDPALLLLDEPTRSLDADAMARLWGALERRPRTAVLIATHRHDDVARCQRVTDLPS
jgi:ABC-type multidrug transport system ATPase subunit